MPVLLERPKVNEVQEPQGFEGSWVGEAHGIIALNNPMNRIDPTGLCSKQCKGRARVLQGNSDLIGQPGGLSTDKVDIDVAAGSAAVIPSQWGGKALLRKNYDKISGSIGSMASFSGVTDVIGSSDVSGVQDVLQKRYPGLLILELPSADADLGIQDVVINVPSEMPCPTGTSEKK